MRRWWGTCGRGGSWRVSASGKSWRSLSSRAQGLPFHLELLDGCRLLMSSISDLQKRSNAYRILSCAAKKRWVDGTHSTALFRNLKSSGHFQRLAPVELRRNSQQKRREKVGNHAPPPFVRADRACTEKFESRKQTTSRKVETLTDGIFGRGRERPFRFTPRSWKEPE